MLEYSYRGNKIAYASYGGGSRVVILLHDVGGSSQDFIELAASLQRNNLRLIAVDLCGHGESYLPRSTVSLRTMAREIVNLLRDCYLGKVDAIACGVGGAVLLEAMRLQPEAFGKVVLLDTFICQEAWQVCAERPRPTGNTEREVRFRNTFKRWIPAYRDDFFIFCAEFDGRAILEQLNNRGLFVYGGRGRSEVITADRLQLSGYANISFRLIPDADRWMLQRHYREVLGIIEDFLFGSDSVSGKGQDSGVNPDEPGINLNNLMYLR